MEKRNNKIRKDDLEHELRNTTVGQFRKLGEAISQLGVSFEDACKATQSLGEAFNSVPPYHYERRKSVCVIGVIKTAVIVLTLLSLILFIVQDCI